jgi:eukaryotic-like serine/threonine-protein kinase
MMIDLTGQQFGNYRLVRLLGTGGFASVYLGEHVHIASLQVAIKILHLVNVDKDRFRREAETMVSLIHPHIMWLLDFAIQQETPFLVMDYAPAGSLLNQYPRGTQVPLKIVVQFVKEISLALQYAHDQNILHRDVKPENILIGRDGKLLLSDFGLATLSKTGRTSLQPSYGREGGNALLYGPGDVSWKA